MSDPVAELTRLSEGNPGALTALVDLLEHPDGTKAILSLKRHNITGAEIWVGYSDHCGKNADEFASKLISDDPALLDEIESYRTRRGE